jgi:carboxymethylenebutenolidase
VLGRPGRFTEFEVPHDVKNCPGVGHGFITNPDAGDRTLMLRFPARISGTAYDEAVTRDARNGSSTLPAVPE